MERSATDRTGQIVASRYEIQEILSEGSLSTVYSANTIATGETVATKILNDQVIERGSYAERFEREHLVCSRMQSPLCLRMLEFGILSSGVPFQVMEYVPGESLADILDREERLPVDRALVLFSKVLQALMSCSDAGIIHRDVKPENFLVFVDAQGVEQVKLIGFGIAKLIGQAAQGHDRLTSIGLVLGTPHYIAPEWVSSDNVDARADLYSATVMLFEMLTSAPPFLHEDKREIMTMHLRDAPPSLADRVPGEVFVPNLEAIIVKGLAKMPKDRFSGAREYLNELALLNPALGIAGAVPAGQFSGPAGQFSSPAGQSPGPAGQSLGPSGQFPGPSGQFPGPSGQFPGPSGQFPGPAGQSPGQGGQSPGQGGQSPGQGGQSPGQGGQFPGPAGQSPIAPPSMSQVPTTGTFPRIKRGPPKRKFIVAVVAVSLVGLALLLIARRSSSDNGSETSTTSPDAGEVATQPKEVVPEVIDPPDPPDTATKLPITDKQVAQVTRRWTKAQMKVSGFIVGPQDKIANGACRYGQVDSINILLCAAALDPVASPKKMKRPAAGTSRVRWRGRIVRNGLHLRTEVVKGKANKKRRRKIENIFKKMSETE